MNDDKLKELFANDHSTPKRPAGEWNRIQHRISEEKKSFHIFPQIAASVFVLTLVILGISVKLNLNKQTDDELAQFLFSSDYFAEEELSFYSSDI